MRVVRRRPRPIFLAPPPVIIPPAAPLAAAVAEAASALALSPIDVWKARAHAPRAAAPRTPFRPFAATMPAVTLAALDSLAFVGAYRLLRWALAHGRRGVGDGPADHQGQPPRLAWVTSAVAGAGASVLAAVATTPADLVVQRLRGGAATSAAVALSSVASWRDMYVGVWPTVARDLPFDAMEFATFEAIQRRVLRSRGRGEELSFTDNLVIGMVTGAVVSAVVAPLDLVVTRVLLNPAKYRGVFGCIARTVREEGIAALYRGAPQKVLRETIASGLFFSCYETALSFNFQKLIPEAARK